MIENTKSSIEDIVKNNGRGPRWRRWALWMALLAAAALLIVPLLRSASQTTENSYVTERAIVGDIVVTVSATGTVEPTNLVEISSELSGTIQSVEVDFNDVVAGGQILARLDTEKLEATLEHARATVSARQARVSEAQATVDEARETYERMVQLEQRGVVAAQDFTSAMSALRRANAALASANADARVAAADLEIDEANLAKACICSPIDGVILDRNVDVGQIVASSLQAPVLFTIAEDLRRMELRVDIDEADIGKVQVGNPAEFRVEAYQNRRFPAVISEIRYAPQTIDGVVTYKAILSIDNADLLLRPGMTATAEIVVSEVIQKLLVTNAALRFSPPVVEEEEETSGLLGMLISPPTRRSREPLVTDEDGWRSIWVLRHDVIVEVAVRIGETDGTHTEILEGDVADGDAIVADIQVN